MQSTAKIGITHYINNKQLLTTPFQGFWKSEEGVSSYGIFTNVCLTYPNGRLIQGEGVKIDIPVITTKERLRNGEDEILQAALKYLIIGNK